MTTETQELLTNMKVLSVLAKIKNEIKDRMDFSNPCIACDEYKFLELRASGMAFEECLEIIDGQIKELTKD